MQLNEKQKQYFAAMQDTFRTKGWEQMQIGWKSEMEQIPKRLFFNAKSYEDMIKERERYSVLVELTNLAQTIDAQKVQIEEAELDQDV